MLPFKVIHAPNAVFNLGAHVFPAIKYKRVAEKLRSDGIAGDGDFVAARLATDDEILRVHTREYLAKLRSGRFSEMELRTMEVPWSPQLFEAFVLAAGAAIQAASHARRDGCSVALSGGFHHAFPDHGEGFCLIHDVAVAVESLRAAGEASRIAIVDLDVHQGNGSAVIFAGREDVFTGSVHQEWLYPSWKPPSTVDIGLPDGATDEPYLEAVDELLGHVANYKPDAMFYVAGADPYEHDRLGGLAVTLDGLRERDRRVFDAARQLEAPIVATLAGGYAEKTSDTVGIHVNMVREAAAVFGR